MENPPQLSETWLYTLFVKGSMRLLQTPLALLDLCKRAVEHLRTYENVRELAADVREKIGIILRMLDAHARGKYTQVSVRNLVLSIGAMLYLVSPLDFIPDFIVGGLVDDIGILLWVFNNMRREIEEFLAWEDQHKTRIDL